MLIADLIPALDSFELSLSVLKDGDPAKKGVELIRSQLEDILKKHGLERIKIQRRPFRY